MKQKNNPKIAIVYDKVNTQYGGAEWVLVALHNAFPTAPLFTALYDAKQARWASVFTVFSSFLQRSPLKKHTFLVWLFPLAFESLDLSDYDIIISVTSGEAKGVLTKPNQLHISYILTPPRYLYTHVEQYLNQFSFLRLPIISQITHVLLSYLRWWDQAAARRPDVLIAISKVVQKRIYDIYSLSSSIIYPPLPEVPKGVAVSKISSNNSFLLTLSRLVSYKRIDLAILAALKTNKSLVVAGNGEEFSRLQILAGQHTVTRTNEDLAAFISKETEQPGKIIFVGTVSNEERLALLASAEALLMPGIEDFGITALEAANLGTPSILHAKSGVSEILTHNTASIHISEESVSALAEGIEQLAHTSFSIASLQKQANTCSTNVFTRKFKENVYDGIIQSEKN